MRMKLLALVYRRYLRDYGTINFKVYLTRIGLPPMNEMTSVAVQSELPRIANY